KGKSYEEEFRILVSDDFFTTVYGHKKAPMDEPPKESITHFIWQMLQFDPKDRITASELHTQFEAYYQCYITKENTLLGRITHLIDRISVKITPDFSSIQSLYYSLQSLYYSPWK